MPTELPSIVPLFPLPNLVLFPGVSVPLRIFEPRYREMIADVSASHGIIGMALLKGEWQERYYGHPDIFEVGCAGKISDLVKLPDGRYNIVLDGIGEFRLRREIRERSYRQAEIEWNSATPAERECDDETIEGLREVLFSYLGEPALEAWKTMVEERRLRGADLVNFLCFHLDVTPLEKQTLLEATRNRADCLIDVLTFRLEERRRGGSSGPGSDTVQ